MTQAGLWWCAGAAALIAVGAGWAESRRARRQDLDRAGIVPWGAMSLLGFIGALVALAIALGA